MSEVLTTCELLNIDKRIDEIASILEYCDEDDIVFNLETEMDVLIAKLEKKYYNC